MKYPYLTVALLVFFSIIDIGILGNHYELTKTDWPGWVQAIGSIGALGVAIFVMKRQSQHAIALALGSDKRTLIRRASSVKSLIERANSHIGSCLDTIKTVFASSGAISIDEFRTFARGKLAEARRTLVAIPSHELGSFDLTDAVQNMIECIADVEVIINAGSPADVIASQLQYIGEIEKQFDRATSYRNDFEDGLLALENS